MTTSFEPPNSLPRNDSGASTVRKVYLAYCAFLIVLYVASAGAMAWLLTLDIGLDAEDSSSLMLAMVMCVVGAAAYAVPFFLGRSATGHSAGFVFIALGLTSCVTIPPAIWLLIQWMKEENKPYLMGFPDGEEW